MIYGLHSKACLPSGTYYPELAIGIRAAAEAFELLNIDEDDLDLYCVAECTSRYLDGIQMIFCITVGNELL